MFDISVSSLLLNASAYLASPDIILERVRLSHTGNRAERSVFNRK